MTKEKETVEGLAYRMAASRTYEKVESENKELREQNASLLSEIERLKRELAFQKMVAGQSPVLADIKLREENERLKEENARLKDVPPPPTCQHYYVQQDLNWKKCSHCGMVVPLIETFPGAI